MKGMLNAIFFILAGYFAWGYYSFTSDPSSELGVRRGMLEAKRAEISTNEAKIAEARTFFQNLERKREELRRLSNELGTMKSTLTENNDVPTFMKLILNEAKRVGLTVTSLSPLPSQSREYYVEQPFDMSFQGVYVQLVAFLDRVAQAERIVRIDDFSVRPRTAGARNAKFVELEGSLKVRTFVYLSTREDDIANKGGSDEVKAAGGTKVE